MGKLLHADGKVLTANFEAEGQAFADHDKAARVTTAMMQMKKLDILALERAARPAG